MIAASIKLFIVGPFVDINFVKGWNVFLFRDRFKVLNKMVCLVYTGVTRRFLYERQRRCGNEHYYTIHRGKMTACARDSNSYVNKDGGMADRYGKKMRANTVEHTIKTGRNGVWVQPS